MTEEDFDKHQKVLHAARSLYRHLYKPTFYSKQFSIDFIPRLFNIQF